VEDLGIDEQIRSVNLVAHDSVNGFVILKKK
jgi:hypothetical protein